MNKLTFFINPFSSEKSKKIEFITNPMNLNDVLNYESFDHVFYTIDRDQGHFIVDDDFLFHRSAQQTYAFKCNGGYHYILGDKSVFKIETNKSPNEMLKKLRELILFPNNDFLNQMMIKMF